MLPALDIDLRKKFQKGGGFDWQATQAQTWQFQHSNRKHEIDKNKV